MHTLEELLQEAIERVESRGDSGMFIHKDTLRAWKEKLEDCYEIRIFYSEKHKGWLSKDSSVYQRKDKRR